MADSSDDPWGFLADRKPKRVDAAPESSTQPAAPEPAAPEQPAGDAASTPQRGLPAKRAHGEFRNTIESVPLKRRAWPIAASLALVSVAGFLTEIVAAAQVISLAGPRSMLYVYPLGGIGLVLLALAQFTYIDGRARLPTIRVVALIYAALFAIGLALLAGSVLPVVAGVLVWLLADQLNFLLPLMIWSLAADEFNVAEGRKVFGWIVTWTYLGQVVGLAIATAGAPLLSTVGIPLTWLLVVAPVLCVIVAWWLPRAMRGSAAATGLARQENMSTSLRSAWTFVAEVPVWRQFLLASSLTFIAGMLIFIGFLAGAENQVSADAERIQLIFGLTTLVSFLICWLVQVFVAEPLQNRIGIPGVLLILPIATVVAAVALLAGVLAEVLPLMAVGAALWLIPRWSVDENARRAALALVPDERRTRVSFVVDLGPVALGLILSGPVAAIGLLTGALWLVPASAAVLAAAAIVPAVKVLRGWEDSLLSWRLRRRKRNRTIGLMDL